MIPVHIFDKICQNCHICSIQHENWENIFLFYFKYYKSFSNYHDLFCKVFLLVCAQICDFTGQQHFFVVAITQTFLDAAFPNYKFIWWLKKKKDLWKFQAFIFFFKIFMFKHRLRVWCQKEAWKWDQKMTSDGVSLFLYCMCSLFFMK